MFRLQAHQIAVKDQFSFVSLLS